MIEKEFKGDFDAVEIIKTEHGERLEITSRDGKKEIFEFDERDFALDEREIQKVFSAPAASIGEVKNFSEMELDDAEALSEAAEIISVLLAPEVKTDTKKNAPPRSKK